MSKNPWVNYHHLHYFQAVANTGSMTKAAKILRIGQPTLSTQIKQFEDSLGYQLFDRTNRRLQLTEAGRMALDYASQIFRLGDEMVNALRGEHFSEKRKLHIGAMDTVSKHLILNLYQSNKLNKDCMTTFSEGHGEELLRELHAHRLDLVISNYAPPIGSGSNFNAKCIARMPVVICGAKKYLNIEPEFPEGLNNQEFVMPSYQSKLRHDVDHFLKLSGVFVNVIAEVQDTSLQKLMGVHGEGLIPIALPAAKELIASKELYLIGILPNVFEELWLISAERKIQNPVAISIMESFKVKF